MLIFLIKLTGPLFNMFGAYKLFIRMNRILNLPKNEIKKEKRDKLFNSARNLFLEFIFIAGFSLGAFSFNNNLIELIFTIFALIVGGGLFFDYFDDVEEYSIKIRDNEKVKEFFRKAVIEVKEVNSKNKYSELNKNEGIKNEKY